MSEVTEERTAGEKWADGMRVRIARDLREIENLYDDLREEAFNLSDDHEMPGGDALVMLGPSADPEAWGYAEMSAALGRIPGHGLDEQDSDPCPPLLTLAGWSDVVRAERGTPTDLQATISREVAYLRKSIDWIVSEDSDGEAVFLPALELADDLHRVVIRMENVLKAGKREEKTETPCEEEGCGRLLVKLYGAGARFDRFECPSHRKPFDYPEYVAIRQRHMWSERADNAWIAVSDAAKSIGRSQFTIRQWMKPKPSTKVPYHGCRVRSRRVGAMNRIEVYWPDVRDQDQIAIRKVKLRRAKIA